MWPVATDFARSMVCVCVLGTWMCPAKMDEPVEMPFGRANLNGPKASCTRVEISHWNDQFWGGAVHWKALVVSHSVLSNGMTADCNAADWSVSHYIVTMKNLPLTLLCGLLSETFDQSCIYLENFAVEGKSYMSNELIYYFNNNCELSKLVGFNWFIID